MSRFKVGDKVRILQDAFDDEGYSVIDGNLKSAVSEIGLVELIDVETSGILVVNLPIECGEEWFYNPDQIELVTIEPTTKAPSLQWQQYSATKKYVIIEGLIWCYINQQLIDGSTKFVATNGYTNEVICVVDTIEKATEQAEAYYGGLIGRVFAVSNVVDLVKHQKTSPPEFEKIFSENISELLA